MRMLMSTLESMQLLCKKGICCIKAFVARSISVLSLLTTMSKLHISKEKSNQRLISKVHAVYTACVCEWPLAQVCRQCLLEYVHHWHDGSTSTRL